MSQVSGASVKGAWAMSLGFFALILAVSSIPAESMPRSPELWRWDKLVHAMEYGVAAALFFRAMHRGPKGLAQIAVPYRVLLCLVVCGGFGILDELYQGTVPGRNSSPYDMLADIAGATFATIASAVFYSRLATGNRS